MKGVESSTIPALLSEIRVDDIISALPSGVTDFQNFAYCIDYFIHVLMDVHVHKLKHCGRVEETSKLEFQFYYFLTV